MVFHLLAVQKVNKGSKTLKQLQKVCLKVPGSVYLPSFFVHAAIIHGYCSVSSEKISGNLVYFWGIASV